jgi:hypothetical protein
LLDFVLSQNRPPLFRPATYISISSCPSSLDPPQLTKATSTHVFLHTNCLMV